MIATNDYNSTTCDYYTSGESDSTTSLMDIPGLRDVIESIQIYDIKPLDSMTPEEKFAFWGEIFRELREKIKQMARAAIGLLSIIPEAPFRPVLFHRRICTPMCPTQHYKIHNHPVRFVREGL